MSEDKVPIVGEEVRRSSEPLRIRTWEKTLNEGSHKKPMNEKVDALTYVKPFPIKEVDLLTIKRMIQFCRFNSKNDWGVGLKMLLDYVEQDAKTMMLYNKICDIESHVEELVDRVAAVENKPQEKEVKTFGGGKKK